MTIPKNVIVIIGCGGMGVAIARRIGSGSHIILADYSSTQLENAMTLLRPEGLSVEGVETNVSDFQSVQKLARYASEMGHISIIAHTAGVSPAQAPLDQIYKVDLLGTTHVIDAFLEVASAGTSLVAIASMAGHQSKQGISPEFEKHLATSPAETLLSYPELEASISNLDSAHQTSMMRGMAYGVSKWGNILRVQASASAWAKKGARINSVSPGVISTAMGQQELEGDYAQVIKSLIQNSPAGRIGTASDVANAVAFLSGPEASFITGNDLLVDGGCISAQTWDGN
ncbi:hypothetical protein FE257_007109 [Aspergillus nanangensis]|uniref:SDR family oxidoreductase n=1 Tax=Aspergillus nanangensis TaxID=2582783 RepID=A0AAD4GUE0_ASPNN|nr:hypothetical protein FE257_007109 [Aspergillus nanangensis]